VTDYTEDDSMQSGEFAPVTPGEILKEEFLAEYDLSQGAAPPSDLYGDCL